MSKQRIIVEKVAALIAGFSAVILIISVSYDFGFLLYLGISLAEAPTSLSDHIRTSLVWAPTILILGATVFELFNRRIEQGMSEKELTATFPTLRFTAWFRDSPKYLVYAFAFFLPFSPSASPGENESSVLFNITLAASCFVVRCLQRSHRSEKYPEWKSLLFL